MGKQKDILKKRFEPDEGYIALAAAVLHQAIEDYKSAVKHKRRGEVKAIERFFLSVYGQTLSFNNGELIVERLHKEIDTDKMRQDDTN